MVEAIRESDKSEKGKDVREVLCKPAGLLASRLLKPILNLMVDRESEEIVQSSLLSGGIDAANLHLFSSASLGRIVDVCGLSLDQELTDAFVGAQ